MFTRTFHPVRFFQSVHGTEPFADYCRERGIAFEQTPGALPGSGDGSCWMAALAGLPREQRAAVELELATVNELAGPDGTAHLIEAAPEPPPPQVPGGAALALWFFLHHRGLFHEVFLHHEIQEVDAWRMGSAPAGVTLPDLDATAGALSSALGEFFRLCEGTGRFCAVDAHRLSTAYCFVTQIADRLQFVETFTEGGTPALERLRPALPVHFVYSPEDGTVLVKSHLRSFERTAELLRRFGQAVLGADVACAEVTFDLDRLKRPFHPLPDAADMESIRLKSLQLRYPARDGRQQIKLETLTSDEPDAIEQLLHNHFASDTLSQLLVCYAELQVRLRVGGRSKSYLIRLWRDRSNLSQTPLGDRFRACLRCWGLSHAPKP